MIALDLISAASLLLSFFLFLVFSLWIRYNFIKDKKADYGIGSFEQCPYCTHIFFDYLKDTVRVCPKCKSLLG